MWETLYDSFWDKLCRFCCRLTRDQDAAEDLAQETFLRAMGHAGLLSSLSAPQQKAWLFETAHNLYCDAARRAAKEQELLQKYAPAPGEEPADDTASLAMYGVELAAVFDKLPLRDAALFSMRYDEGYTAAELAKMTGEPAATIRTRLHRIRKHLQQTLKED